MADNIIQSLVEVIPPHLQKEMERELINGWRMRESVAMADSIQHGKFNRANEAREIDGLGRKTAQIPADSYHYWGQRLGYDCWKDKQFMKEFIRDNPQCAVNNYVKKTVVNGTIFGADGFKI
jgi:hypothetical protein